MKSNLSVNLNTRNIKESDDELRIIRTNLKKVPESGSKFAVMELSTKAVKLLIGKDVEAIRANIDDPKTRFDFRNFIRVSDKVEAGKGLDAQNVMSVRYFAGRVLPSILQKRELMLENDVDTVYTVATAAYRTASNREDIIDLIRSRARINVRILSKQEEAMATLFAYTFTSSCRAELLKSPYVVMIDQGGGSTEVSVFRNCKLVGDPFSMNLGTTALRNFVFRESQSSLPLEQAFKNSDRKIKERLVTFYKNMGDNMPSGDDVFCVGVGTAITRAVGKSGNAQQHDKVMSREFIRERIAKAEAYILERVKTIGELDHALGGCSQYDSLDGELTLRLGLPLILFLMEKYCLQELHVSGTGLWYGIYLQRLLNASEIFD